MHCSGFLLLCMTTFAPQTIENLRVHKLTLPHENLKLKTFPMHVPLIIPHFSSNFHQCFLFFLKFSHFGQVGSPGGRSSRRTGKALAPPLVYDWVDGGSVFLCCRDPGQGV